MQCRRVLASLRAVVSTLWRDDRGQDLIEYALLTAAIGVVGIGVWPMVEANVGLAYAALSRRALDLSAPPEPGAGR